MRRDDRKGVGVKLKGILYGQPMAGIAMWFGILVALLLCFATAISYAELETLLGKGQP
jgi:hypothetical protein